MYGFFKPFVQEERGVRFFLNLLFRKKEVHGFFKPFVQEERGVRVFKPFVQEERGVRFF